MPRVLRLLVYDFHDEASLEKQISGSLAEGVRKVNEKGTIRVVNIPSPSAFWRKIRLLWGTLHG